MTLLDNPAAPNHGRRFRAAPVRKRRATHNNDSSSIVPKPPNPAPANSSPFRAAQVTKRRAINNDETLSIAPEPPTWRQPIRPQRGRRTVATGGARPKGLAQPVDCVPNRISAPAGAEETVIHRNVSPDDANQTPIEPRFPTNRVSPTARASRTLSDPTRRQLATFTPTACVFRYSAVGNSLISRQRRAPEKPRATPWGKGAPTAKSPERAR